MELSRDTLQAALIAGALYGAVPLAASCLAPNDAPQTQEEIDRMCHPQRPAVLAHSCAAVKDKARKDLINTLNLNDSSANNE